MHDDEINKAVAAPEVNAMDEIGTAEIHNESLVETGVARNHIDDTKQHAGGTEVPVYMCVGGCVPPAC